MSWNLGRPVFGRLPACYRNDNNGENPSNWLTRYWDEILVEVKFRAENFYELYLNPATAPEEWLDGMVAPLCGFTEEYYRPEWDLAIKRKLCLSAYGYIWPNRGAGHVLDWMLDLHQIDTFPEPHAYYKPEWLRVHDRIRTLTQDLDSTGTPAEFLGRIAEAIEVDATINGDRVILPITDDDWYYHDTAYAIKLHRLPFELEYDRFQLDLSRLGDGLHEGDPYEPIAVDRSRHIDGATRLPGILRDRPFDAWIRLQPSIDRDSDTWRLAQELHDLYTPIYIEGGACYDYFRVGMSVLGDPLFDPVFERAKPISLEMPAPCETIALFDRLIDEWGFDAFMTDLDRGGVHIRFRFDTTNPSDLDRQTWQDASRLIKLFSSWPGSTGWDYFRLGFSTLNHRLWGWLDDQAQSIIDNWSGTETGLHLAVLDAIESAGELDGRWVKFTIDDVAGNMQWLNVQALRDRFGLNLTPCYVDFLVGHSHLSEPFFSVSGVDHLRETLVFAGYTWEEFGGRFAFPESVDLPTLEDIVAESGASFVIPMLDHFFLDRSRLRHRLRDWLGDRVSGLIQGWTGTESGLFLAVLAAIESRGIFMGNQVRFTVENAESGSQWLWIQRLRDRFGLNLEPSFVDFFLGHSRIGDELTTQSAIEDLRGVLSRNGYAWQELGLRFAFSLSTDLGEVATTAIESGADYLVPCFDAFALDRSELGHPIFFWDSYQGLEELRASFVGAGYTFEEFDRYRFAFPRGTNLDPILEIIAGSNAAFAVPCFDAFVLGESRLGHLIFT